jgi:hypothetical protein
MPFARAIRFDPSFVGLQSTGECSKRTSITVDVEKVQQRQNEWDFTARSFGPRGGYQKSIHERKTGAKLHGLC